MKTIVFAVLAALPFSVLGQQNAQRVSFPDNGIYRSASDFAAHTLTDGFDTGQPGYRLKNEVFEPVVKVDEPNQQEVKLSMATLWGERKLGVDYRIVDGQLYRVEHADRVIIYSLPANTITGAGWNTYYFSRELNSPIYLITAKHLSEVYYDQPAKLTAFDGIDWQNDHPSVRARQLVEAFYKPGVTSQAAE
ncbi:MULTISPECIES: hypothetical protein [unclassified Spirosoma]|uniref:hypothetical protein n=1 Tax=unclassified Spirosoma TaxID=2621999 RepID=UPI00095BD7FC|nr:MULTISPECIES: hypothetical protein [unclassified Spirosoma]MBN8822281.1 hypothetical protein [Spirosoma sp.]OJW72413.1 MAG: hypothetical protein BGO59_14855 [Spirosoma sp. 48-14]